MGSLFKEGCFAESSVSFVINRLLNLTLPIDLHHNADFHVDRHRDGRFVGMRSSSVGILRGISSLIRVGSTGEAGADCESIHEGAWHMGGAGTMSRCKLYIRPVTGDAFPHQSGQ